ncbi:hypothetical protein J6590_051014 [Homalodisca vitripennis]|nr:hypothetical protein J6590_051014 [Homalodisca vitripennis]
MKEYPVRVIVWFHLKICMSVTTTKMNDFLALSLKALYVFDHHPKPGKTMLMTTDRSALYD